MLRMVLILGVLIPFTKTNKVDDSPPDIIELIPKELRDFVNSLTDADKVVLAEIRRNATFLNEEQGMAALEIRSPSLAAKIREFQTLVGGKIDALIPEAQAFAKDIFLNAPGRQQEGLRPSRIHMTKKMLDIMDRYGRLSDAAKLNFQTQFPFLAQIYANEKLRKVLEDIN
ncbi:unnamed protein product [Cylicocyclus nassatus]|uniref:Nematode fatty acid retinoid binding protein n=1 Tax=Cylicocyclus nassatus TaxID=53992 RepID=A0AA36GUD1_CYLNA|nr:unnamed protein product [Cylicocyclus nassatus]